ncbi:MAG: TIGR03936 family radical SAM-associated protein, partial [Cyanobacteria bacterium P01_A01_bin.114]
HLDTGIDKQWLKDDLSRALAAAVVPDCSFEGCSHCGICGTDFGHNVVVPPPAIPAFEGHFKPNQTRAQRLRIRLGKLGEMALIGHLDLARLLDRAVRRAALPITFTGGYHPGPRISPANALPLGATSTGEIIDFELTTFVEPEIFRAQLGAQLPPDLPVYEVANVDLSAPAATKVLEKAEYFLSVSLENSVAARWDDWVAQVLAADDIVYQQPQKARKKSSRRSGQKSEQTRSINLRERLFNLRVIPETEPLSLPGSAVAKLRQSGRRVLQYVGSCRNDGTLLRPEQVVFMLEQVEHQSIQLGHIHRNRLLLE